MDKVSAKLTVFFEEPFWVGVFERISEDKLSACKITFGAEPKDKIGAVALTEIYDILKMGQAFNEEKYKDSLEEMLRQSIDYEDDHRIKTEWDV